MRRSRIREMSMEITVGAFLFMVLLALGFFTIVLSRENIFRKGYLLEVVFPNVMGLREGDNVFVRGVSVGRIKSLRVEEQGVRLVARLDIPLEIHEDYVAEVLPSSVLGGRYLNIHEGSPGAPVLPPGTVLRGRAPVDLMDEASRTLTMVKDALGEGGVLRNLEDTMAEVRTLAARLSSGEGTLGKLATDDELYQELKRLLHDVRATVDDFREVAPITTFTSIFFGAF